MSTWEERKERRRRAHEARKGLVKTMCTACNGTGRYDTGTSPACECCNGTGYVWVPPGGGYPV